MTLTDAYWQLRELGMSIRATPEGEFRVNFRGGTEDTAYYTTDLEDAVQTGIKMSNRQPKQVTALTLKNGESVTYDGKVRYRGLTWNTIAAFIQRDNARGYVLTDGEIQALYALAK